MPHRVADFFRSHSNNFDIVPTDFKKAPRRSSSSQRRPALSDRSPSSSASSVSSDHSFKMPDHKRLSLQGLSLGSHTPKSSSSKNPHAPLELAIKIESPPLVFYGPAATSTGALLSGQFLLHVHEEPAIIENFKLRLVVETIRKKPFHSHCAECAQQTNELTKWEFHQGQTTLNNGSHDYPFSFLFPGHLPASMNSSLVKIDYVLKGTVTPKGGEPIKISKTLNIQRALTPADAPKKSIRIFPPTNLTANCTLPPVIHPIGDSNLTMRLDGVVKKNEDAKTQTQWRLKRMTWRLDEVHKEISPACPKHLAKLTLSEEHAKDMKKKGTPHESVRTLNSEELKSGWKADYSAEAGGSIDMEFAFSIKPDAHPICDMKTEDGTEVSHILIVEMIVAEEFAPIAKPTQVTPTGAARVLRMHFTTIVTERSGLGISWDEEQPPLYENVPASPPSYGHVLDLEINDQELPDYESLPALDSLTLTTQHASTTLAPPPPAHLSPDPRRSDEHGL